MADRIRLTNDTPGYKADEATYVFNTAGETSAYGASAARVPLFIAPEAGRVVDVVIGVVAPPLSASGFVSGTATAQVRINSSPILSTAPAIVMASTSAQVTRVATNTGNALATAGVVNQASATFAKGDQIAIDWNLQSGGSAAAGAAGAGLYVAVKVRYSAT